MKIKVIALDIIGNALEWLDQNGDEDHMELCEILTLNDDSPVPVWELNNYNGWDYLLVFEVGTRDHVVRLLDELGITSDKVIYPLDITGSMLENRHIASYIFGEYIRRILRYLSYRADGEKYSIANIPGLSYINASTDNVILPDMIKNGRNWADNDMRLFYDLSKKHFDFRDDQNIFCDIGANIGTTCIYFKKHLDKNVEILAFEPSYENHKMLLSNAILNDIDISQHHFIRKGLSDSCTSAYLQYDPYNPGGSFLADEISDGRDKIDLVTLDAYIEENAIDPSRFKYLWVDVEGFEARFLAGARKTLSAINAPVFMEFIPKFYKDKDGEFDLLIDELSNQFKYCIVAQDPELKKVPIDMLLNERDNLALQCDLFLLKE